MFLPEEKIVKRFIDLMVDFRIHDFQKNLLHLGLVLVLLPGVVFVFDLFSFPEHSLFIYYVLVLLLLSILSGRIMIKKRKLRKMLSLFVKEGENKNYVFLFPVEGLQVYPFTKCFTILHFMDLAQHDKSIRLSTRNKFFIKFCKKVKGKPIFVLTHESYPHYVLPVQYISYFVKQIEDSKANSSLLKKFLSFT